MLVPAFDIALDVVREASHKTLQNAASATSGAFTQRLLLRLGHVARLPSKRIPWTHRRLCSVWSWTRLNGLPTVIIRRPS